MISPRMNASALRDPGWWHWTATLPMLALNLAGHAWAGWSAMALCGLFASYFLARLKSFQPYAVQVRLAYLIVLGCGMLPGMTWFHWVPLIGTTTMVIAGYCPLLRLLTLAPWNRTVPLSVLHIGYVFLSVRCAGGLVNWNVDSSSTIPASCSIQSNKPPVTCSYPMATVTVHSSRRKPNAKVH